MWFAFLDSIHSAHAPRTRQHLMTPLTCRATEGRLSGLSDPMRKFWNAFSRVEIKCVLMAHLEIEVRTYLSLLFWCCGGSRVGWWQTTSKEGTTR
jgi:hypothetical protein